MKCVIIDLYNLFYRSYSVIPAMNAHGHIGGLFGSLKSLQKIVRETSPDEVVIAWDGPGGSQKRRQINKGYKEGRKPVKNYNRAFDMQISDEEMERNKNWQITRLAEYLNIFPVKQFMFDGVEADDVIAFCSRYHKYDDVIIVSNDKDFYQLVSDQIKLLRPVKKDIILSEEDVIEKFKIHPTNMALARAIVGDKSDNLKGVSGVGFKTVTKCFPELSGSKSVFIDDVLEKAKNPPRTLKAYEGVADNEEVIKENYSIMQLYSPKISVAAKQEIKEVLDLNKVEFNQTQFRCYRTIDQFPDYKWNDLESEFRRITRNGEKRDELWSSQ